MENPQMPKPAATEQKSSALTDDKLRKMADSLIQKWSCEETALEENRQLRKQDWTPEELKAKGLIDPSETYIGFRVIDENIAREIPIFLKYISGSSRQLIFKPLNQAPDFPIALLEQEFTAYVRYENWQSPFYQVFDSAALHGRGVMEVIADGSKHAGISCEFIESQDFLFPTQSRGDIQNAPMVVRRYHWNAEELKQNAEYSEFKKAEVDRILNDPNEADVINKCYKVYKLYYRKDNTVMCAWYSKDANDTFLKEPYIHVSGKYDTFGKPVPVSYYPFFVLQYRLTEETKLTQTMGRAKLDKYNQEGQCRLGTSFVNGVARSAHIYASAKGSMTDSNTIEATVSIVPNKIMNKDVSFVSIPAPDAIVVQAIGMLAGRNSQATGQVDYTAKNRQDSRKTAKEIEAAQQQASELSGITIFAVSQFCLKVFAYQWYIIQSNAVMQLDSQFLVNVPPEYRMPLLTSDYNLLPAGDIDYVERQQKINRMLDFWPLIANTPAAVPFIKKLIMLALPDEATELMTALEAQGDPRTSMGAAIIEILAQVPREALLSLFPDPNTQQQFNQILDEAINVYRSQSEDGGTQGAPQQPSVPGNSQPNSNAVQQRNRQSAPIGARS